MMETAVTAELRSALEAEHARLSAEIAEHGHSGAGDPLAGGDAYRDQMGDAGSATYEREMDVSMLEDARGQLARVDRALRRIDEDAYGTCTRCSNEIPLDRLRAVPAAELCVACKAWEEDR